MDQDQTATQTPEQATTPQAPAADGENTFDRTYVESLRRENASWREKYQAEKAKVTELEPMRAISTQYDTLRTDYESVVGTLRETNLVGALCGELTKLGVVDSAKQQILIKAVRSDLSVEFGDDHKPSGEYTTALKAAVDTLGLIAPASPAPPAETPSPPPPEAKPEPISAVPRGPLSHSQSIARAQAALNKARETGKAS
jgi:hypothetical protein